MPHVFVCFHGEWKETGKEYVGGHMKGSNVNVTIKLEKLFGEIYRTSRVNSVEYELILRCLYNVKPSIFAFAISSQEDLQF